MRINISTDCLYRNWPTKLDPFCPFFRKTEIQFLSLFLYTVIIRTSVCLYVYQVRDDFISSNENLDYLMPNFFFFLIISTFNYYLFIYLFIWLCWVFISVRGLPLAAASGGHSSSRCAGLSLSWPLPLRSTGSRRAGSAVVAHGLSSCGSRA